MVEEVNKKIKDILSKTNRIIQEFETMLDQNKSMSCLHFVDLVNEFTSMARPTESLEDIRKLAAAITEPSVDTCSADEKADLRKSSSSLEKQIETLKGNGKGKLT